MKLTPKIQKAIYSAVRLHGQQKRKGSDFPYVGHPVGVAWTLANHTDDEDVICAGLLHDVLEDVPGYSASDMERDFGPRITGIVKEVTEDKDPNVKTDERATWKLRKDKYLNHLREASQEALLVCAADKINNLSAMIEDYKTLGEGLWNKFNCSREESQWYYQEVLKILTDRLKSDIVKELATEVETMGFGQ